MTHFGSASCLPLKGHSQNGKVYQRSCLIYSTYFLSYWAWSAKLSQLLADCDLEIVTMHDLTKLTFRMGPFHWSWWKLPRTNPHAFEVLAFTKLVLYLNVSTVANMSTGRPSLPTFTITSRNSLLIRIPRAVSILPKIICIVIHCCSVVACQFIFNIY